MLSVILCVIPPVWEGSGFIVSNTTHTPFLSEGQPCSSRESPSLSCSPHPICCWWLFPRAAPRAPLQNPRSLCSRLTRPLQLVLCHPSHREIYGVAQSHSHAEADTGLEASFVSALFGVLRCPFSLRGLCKCQDSQVVLPASSPSLRDNPIMN